MPYRIEIKKSAMRALEDIPDPHYTHIRVALYSLINDPRPNGCKKLKNRKGYRIRVGDYRIIYDIFDSILLINVVQIGHRKEVYR